MSQNETRLKYFISRNDTVAVLVLTGRLEHSTLQVFADCISEIQEHFDAKCIVLSLSEVEAVTVDAIPDLAQLQKSIRGRGIELRMSGLSTDLKEKLVKLGVVRHMELANSLQEAVRQASKKAS